MQYPQPRPKRQCAATHPRPPTPPSLQTFSPSLSCQMQPSATSPAAPYASRRFLVSRLQCATAETAAGGQQNALPQSSLPPVQLRHRRTRAKAAPVGVTRNMLDSLADAGRELMAHTRVLALRWCAVAELRSQVSEYYRIQPGQEQAG